MDERRAERRVAVLMGVPCSELAEVTSADRLFHDPCCATVHTGTASESRRHLPT